MTDFPEVHVTTRAQLRDWLTENHSTSPGVWLVSWRSRSGPGVPVRVQRSSNVLFTSREEIRLDGTDSGGCSSTLEVPADTYRGRVAIPKASNFASRLMFGPMGRGRHAGEMVCIAIGVSGPLAVQTS